MHPDHTTQNRNTFDSRPYLALDHSTSYDSFHCECDTKRGLCTEMRVSSRRGVDGRPAAQTGMTGCLVQSFLCVSFRGWQVHDSSSLPGTCLCDPSFIPYYNFILNLLKCESRVRTLRRRCAWVALRTNVLLAVEKS